MDTGSAARAIAPERANPFMNFSIGMLADEIGDIETALKALERRRDDARKEMTRRHLNSAEGARFLVVKTNRESLRFDTAAVKLEMGQDWYDERRKASASITFTVSPVGAPAASPGVPGITPLRAAAEALFKGVSR